MAQANIDYRDCDRQIWEEELADFVPSRILDCPHSLLLALRHYRGGSGLTQEGRQRSRNFESVGRGPLPGPAHAVPHPGAPLPGNRCGQTRGVGPQRESTGFPASATTAWWTPSCKLEDIERDLKHPQFVGLKPYRTHSVTGDIAQCRIHEFLPHEQMEFANHHSLWVTMHLSRFHGCADHLNLQDLEEYTTRRYPNIKWLLAHCARSFTYWPMQEAVERLRDMPNIHYDTSAVTDVRPYISLLTKEDTRRIFWGSDGVGAAFFHGHYAALGRAWEHYDADRGDLQFPHCDGRPILAVYEQLLSMKFAAEIAGLSKDQIEGLFWRNAATALGIGEEEGASND